MRLDSNTGVGLNPMSINIPPGCRIWLEYSPGWPDELASQFPECRIWPRHHSTRSRYTDHHQTIQPTQYSAFFCVLVHYKNMVDSVRYIYVYISYIVIHFYFFLSNASVNWMSVRFYETDWPISYNLTETQYICKLDLGKVLWNGLYLKNLFALNHHSKSMLRN